MTRVTPLLLAIILGVCGCSADSPSSSLSDTMSNSTAIQPSEGQQKSIPEKTKQPSGQNAVEVLNPSMTEGTVSLPKNEILEDAVEKSNITLTYAETQAVLLAVSDIFEQYQLGDGVIAWDNIYDPRFSPFPTDANYPDVKTGVIAFNSIGDVAITYEDVSYEITVSVSNIRDEWQVNKVCIIDKATGMMLASKPPRYAEEERISFHEYLGHNLDKRWYAYFDIVTTHVEPVIGIVPGYEGEIDALLARYNGTPIETKRISCAYSRAYMEECVESIMHLPLVKADYASEQRNISGIFINHDRIEVLLIAPMPELETALTQYPADLLTVVLNEQINPAT